MLPRVTFVSIDSSRSDDCLRKKQMKNLTWAGYFVVNEKRLYIDLCGNFHIVEQAKDIESEYLCI